jgi:hypothetical protein
MADDSDVSPTPPQLATLQHNDPFVQARGVSVVF